MTQISKRWSWRQTSGSCVFLTRVEKFSHCSWLSLRSGSPAPAPLSGLMKKEAADCVARAPSCRRSPRLWFFRWGSGRTTSQKCKSGLCLRLEANTEHYNKSPLFTPCRPHSDAQQWGGHSVLKRAQGRRIPQPAGYLSAHLCPSFFWTWVWLEN